MDKGPLALVLHSGDFDRVHYALSMAAAGLALGRPVTLLFAGRAVRALAGTDAGAPGWHRLDPGPDGRAPAATDADWRGRGIGGFDELLGACVELGVRVLVCDAALVAADMSGEELRQDVPVAPGGLAEFLSTVPKGATALFI